MNAFKIAVALFGVAYAQNQVDGTCTVTTITAEGFEEERACQVYSIFSF